MFGKGLKLFKIFGFEVRIDASWLFLAVLIILGLTGGYFPFHYEGLSTTAYIFMGTIGALGLFASIVIHELSHSVVARFLGTPMKGITLFMFGGIAQMDESPRNAKSEAMMSAAGPAASFILSGIFYLIYKTSVAMSGPVVITGVFGYLAWINALLAVFNLLPAFPLDGGRLLRAALWSWKKNLRWATRIASGIGSGFAILLIVLGIWNLLIGNLVGGLWWCLIGMFLRSISQNSYREVVMRETLSGEPIKAFMKNDPITVPPHITVDELVNDYIYKYHFKLFPVVEGSRLIACVNTRDVKHLPRAEWKEKKVGDIASPTSEKNSISADSDAAKALAIMNQTGNSRLLVVDDDRLAGIVSLKDMLKFLALKLDLEGEEIDNSKLGLER